MSSRYEKIDKESVIRILDNHELWISSDKTEGERALFQGKDLSGIDMSGRNLTEAVFEDSELTKTNFWRSVFRNTILKRTSMEEANFSLTVMSDTTIDNCNLLSSYFTNAQFWNVGIKGTQLSRARFEDATLIFVTFDTNQITEGNFNDTDIQASEFKNNDMAGIRFERAKIQKTHFEKNNLFRASFNFSKVIDTEFINCELKEGKLPPKDIVNLNEMCQGEIEALGEKHGIRIIPRQGFWTIDDAARSGTNHKNIFVGDREEVGIFLTVCEEKSLGYAIQYFRDKERKRI